MTNWTLDKIADLVWRIASAYSDHNANSIISLATSAGMTPDDISEQLEVRESFLRVKREWSEVEHETQVRVMRDEVAKHPRGYCLSESERRALVDKVEAVRKAFFAERGVTL